MQRTALYNLIVRNGGRMVDFAGWEMPIYFNGQAILSSVAHTRAAASIFDVSHMLQTRLSGPPMACVRALEQLMPLDACKLRPSQGKYSMILDRSGGIIDDLTIFREASTSEHSTYRIISNASRANVVNTLLLDLSCGSGLCCSTLDHVLIALQGPLAVKALRESSVVQASESVSEMPFMSSFIGRYRDDPQPITIARCGYTGEDGYEISIPRPLAQAFCRDLLQLEYVRWAGLAARDILRLEASLCLYGQDIDQHATPVEASLGWTIAKSRLLDDPDRIKFPGFERIKGQLKDGVGKKRLGFTTLQGPPPRSGMPILDQDNQIVGKVTSGAFSPTINANIAMAYVNGSVAQIAATTMHINVRGQDYTLIPTTMPFIKTRYHK